MGEEEKKPAAEEKKMEEKKPEEAKKVEGGENKGTEKKEEEKKEEKIKEDSKGSKEESFPPPQEIVLKVYLHCEGCARKVRRWLKGFEGVEDVITDCRASTVVVKGEKADPLKVLNRVQSKSHRPVELISPIPKPPSVEEKKTAEVEEMPKPEEKKEEPPVVTVVLKVYMHCEACAMEMKKRIQRMKGVESAEPDLKSSQVTVKGIFDPPELVEYVYKRTGKHAMIVKQEPEKKEEGEDKGKESKEEEGDKENKEDNKDKKEGDSEGWEVKTDATDVDAAPPTEETKVVEVKKNEYYYNYYPPKYDMELYVYPPQIFSDENPNACFVM